MNALQLKLCDIQGRLFEMFADSEYAAEFLAKEFMNGEIAECLDSEYNRMQWAGEEYLLEELMASVKDKASFNDKGTVCAKRKNVSKEVLFWAGYIYRFWHFYTGEKSKEIYKQASFEVMKANYLMFHTLDSEQAIDYLKEIFKQKNGRG